MPRCFMAKKLKYPYQRWKAAQEGEDEFQNTGEINKTVNSGANGIK